MMIYIKNKYNISYFCIDYRQLLCGKHLNIIASLKSIPSSSLQLPETFNGGIQLPGCEPI